MAISYVAAANNTNGNSTSAFVVNKPTGTAEDDLLVAAIVSTTTYTPPSGWTLIETTWSTSFASRFIMVWYKAAGASEPSNYTLRTASGTPHSDAGGIITLRGAHLTNPAADTSEVVNNDSNTNVVIPAVTGGEFLIGVAGGHANTLWTPPGSMTERWDVKSAGSSPVSCAVATEVGNSGGSRTFVANANTERAGILVAFNPAIPPRGWDVGIVGHSW